MTLPTYVKSKKYIDFMPAIGKSTANAIYPFIFLPNKLYLNLQTDNPNPKHIALLKHEQTHRERQIKLGVLRWNLKYFINPKFRFNEELEAYRVEIKTLKMKGINPDLNKIAKSLSGPLYLWTIDYQTAKDKLKEVFISN